MAKQPEDLGRSKAGERRLSALDRAVQQAVGDGRRVGNPDDPAATVWPSLWEWLTATEDDKRDYVMQPAVVTIQLGPEGALVTLTHRDLRVTCTVSSPTLSDSFACLEAALTGPNPPIRSWGKDEPRLRKRRPKS